MAPVDDVRGLQRIVADEPGRLRIVRRGEDRARLTSQKIAVCVENRIVQHVAVAHEGMAETEGRHGELVRDMNVGVLPEPGLAAVERGFHPIRARESRSWRGSAQVSVQGTGSDPVEGRFGGETRQEIGGDDRLVCPNHLLVARVECRADLLLGRGAHRTDRMIHAVVMGELEEVLDL